MSLKERYEKAKKKLLDDKSICKENRDLFKICSTPGKARSGRFLLFGGELNFNPTPFVSEQNRSYSGGGVEHFCSHFGA